ncbi:hypothetical protein KCV07_g323, partial [Aureobasidium melanogenum]
MVADSFWRSPYQRRCRQTDTCKICSRFGSGQRIVVPSSKEMLQAAKAGRPLYLLDERQLSLLRRSYDYCTPATLAEEMMIRARNDAKTRRIS